MFREFSVPHLTEQCKFLDYSMYHLDGPGAIPHLDALLEIEELDAIQWTPGPKVPEGGDPHWFDMYKRILDVGKSILVVPVRHDRIASVLDSLGTKGVYIQTLITTEQEVEYIENIAKEYRI